MAKIFDYSGRHFVTGSLWSVCLAVLGGWLAVPPPAGATTYSSAVTTSAGLQDDYYLRAYWSWLGARGIYGLDLRSQLFAVLLVWREDLQ